MRSILMCALFLVVISPKSGAQVLYLDSSGDGLRSVADVVQVGGTQRVDVWLVTDRNADGGPSVNRSPSDGGPSLNSYQLVLRAVGGRVQWGSYCNLLSSMARGGTQLSSESDLYVCFWGTEILPPGKYHLGYVTVKVLSGEPEVVLAESSDLAYYAGTAFGSNSPGKDQDNTLKFRPDLARETVNPRVSGDWHEALGLYSWKSLEASRLSNTAEAPWFGVAVAPNPGNPGAVVSVTVTRAGPVKVRLFDASGRLVRIVADVGVPSAGRYDYRLDRTASGTPLPSGVLFYRVETDEGNREGKIVVLK